MKQLQLTLLITLFFSSIAFSQSIEVRRGDDVSKQFTYKGNITADTLVFVVKTDTALSSPRLVQKKNSVAGETGIKATYFATTKTTNIVVFIKAEDMQDLRAKTYVYDLKTYGSVNRTVAIGNLTLLPSVQSPFDGTTLAEDGTRYTTVSLANGTLLHEIVYWDTTTRTWIPSGIVFDDVDVSNKANLTLNNLGTTSINADLLPSGGFRNIGSSSLSWNGVYATQLLLKFSGYVAAISTQTLTATRSIYFPNESGTIALGSGVANQLSYWNTARTLGSLSTTTYPSLAELSYVKGLTSSAQNQLDNKQATLVSGTNIKTVNNESLLGSGNITIVGGGTGGLFETDGNGDLMPNDTTATDAYYELDGNGDIQPI